MQKKMLFLKFSSLGDVILSNYTAMKLKEAYPDYSLTWVTDSMYEEIVASQPWVDNVISWNRKKDGNRGFFDIIKRIRREKYDLLVDMHTTDRSSIMSLFSGIRKRVSPYSGKYPFCLTGTLDQRFSCFSEGLFGCRKYLYSLNKFAVKDICDKNKHKGKIIALPIGASYEKKRWPVESWTEFCRLCKEKDYVLILLGNGRDEVEASDEITANAGYDGIINLVGKLTMNELIDTVDFADATISGDTGTLHIARALGRPVIGLFGPTLLKPGYMESLGATFFTACPDKGCEKWECTKECLSTISPADVCNKLELLLI